MVVCGINFPFKIAFACLRLFGGDDQAIGTGVASTVCAAVMVATIQWWALEQALIVLRSLQAMSVIHTPLWQRLERAGMMRRVEPPLSVRVLMTVLISVCWLMLVTPAGDTRAHAATATVSLVFHGVACVGIAVFCAFVFPQLQRIVLDTLPPVAALAPAASAAAAAPSPVHAATGASAVVHVDVAPARKPSLLPPGHAVVVVASSSPTTMVEAPPPPVVSPHVTASSPSAAAATAAAAAQQQQQQQHRLALQDLAARLGALTQLSRNISGFGVLLLVASGWVWARHRVIYVWLMDQLANSMGMSVGLYGMTMPVRASAGSSGSGGVPHAGPGADAAAHHHNHKQQRMGHNGQLNGH